jgi:uncharacterized protein (DUF1786 family)
LLLTGTIMGGGPSQWAAEDHVRAGLPVFATQDAARSFNDDLNAVMETGIQVISDDEARRIPPDVQRIELRDFDFHAISAAFAGFGVDLMTWPRWQWLFLITAMHPQMYRTGSFASIIWMSASAPRTG